MHLPHVNVSRVNTAQVNTISGVGTLSFRNSSTELLSLSDRAGFTDLLVAACGYKIKRHLYLLTNVGFLNCLLDSLYYITAMALQVSQWFLHCCLGFLDVSKFSSAALKFTDKHSEASFKQCRISIVSNSIQISSNNGFCQQVNNGKHAQ